MQRNNKNNTIKYEKGQPHLQNMDKNKSTTKNKIIKKNIIYFINQNYMRAYHDDENNL